MLNPIRVEVELAHVPIEDLRCESFSSFIDICMGDNFRVVARNVKDVDQLIAVLEKARESILAFPSEA